MYWFYQAVFAIVVAIFQFFKNILKQQRLRHAKLRVERYREIADFRAFGAKGLVDRLSIRATPNGRLHVAFGIMNSFVTTDVVVHNEFLKLANDTIRKADKGRWVPLSGIAESVLDSTIAHFSTQEPVLPLAPLMRVYSFVFMLHVLFSLDTAEIDLDHAQTAGDAINRLWLQSKDQSQPVSENDQELLQDALRLLLPDHFPWDDRSNPLNLIMPAYETMWRVVMLTFVSVAYRDVDEETVETFQRAVNNVPACFDDPGLKDQEVESLAIAKEALRLYPPTKSIYRAFPSTSHVRGTCYSDAADVQYCHRESSIWGTDALHFKPRRFHGNGDGASALSEDMKKAYMPFGVGKHLCPAAHGFGHRVITLLVVTLAKRFGSSQTGLTLRSGNTMLPRSLDHCLATGREDMEGWTLQVWNA